MLDLEDTNYFALIITQSDFDVKLFLIESGNLV